MSFIIRLSGRAQIDGVSWTVASFAGLSEIGLFDTISGKKN